MLRLHSYCACLAAMAAATILLSPPASGSAGGWNPVGPEGGAVTALAVHPAAPETIFAAVEFAGVFRSDDGGLSWRRTGPGLPQHSFQAFAGFAIQPSAPDTIYLPTNSGLFRSIDGGDHWQQIAGKLGQGGSVVLAIAASSTARGVLYAADQSGVLKSVDSGETWARLRVGPAGTGAALSLAVDPTNGNVVYLGTGTGEGFLYKTTDGGASWAPAAKDPGRGPIGALALAVDPGEPRRVFAGTATGVLRSTDGGRTWKEAVTGLSDRHVFALGLAATAPSTLYAGTRSGIFVTRNAGGEWRQVFTLAGVQRVTAVAVSRTEFTRAWAGVWPASGGIGLWQTTDTGKTWSPAQHGIAAAPIDRVAVDPFDSRTLYGAGSGGFYRTRDGGASWIQVPEPFGPGSSFPFLVADPTTSGRLFAARVPAGQAYPALFRSLDQGDHWRELDLPVETFLTSLLVLPGNRLVVGGYLAGVVWSGDGGDTWTVASGEIEGVVVQDLAAAGGAVYAAGYRLLDPRIHPPELRMFRSTDGGETWARIETGLAGLSAFHVVADPDRPGRVFAFVGATLYHSADAGAHWTPVSDFFVHEQVVTDFILAPGSVPVLYVATQNGGVFRSVDGGMTWTALAEGLFDLGARSLAVDPGNPAQLYAALTGGMVGFSGPAVTGCAASPTGLCLHGSRFRVEVVWRDFEGGRGAGQAVALLEDTGYFWFFAPSNAELMVKVLDGRDTNGFFWVFYGALSNVEYHVTVTDTETGRVRVYSNPSGRLGSHADTRAFVAGTSRN